MLNTDYKILSKALMYRVKPYLDNLIHTCQTGFMHGRNIAFNIQKAIDLFNYADSEQLEAVMISLNFEKAFDHVEMCAVTGVLRYFNFSEEFIKWIVLLYTEFQLCTINAGHISPWFTPTRGLHQDACESAIIFVLVMEVLVQNIRDNEKIVGIKIGDIEIKSGQFAMILYCFLCLQNPHFRRSLIP